MRAIALAALDCGRFDSDAPVFIITGLDAVRQELDSYEASRNLYRARPSPLHSSRWQSFPLVGAVLAKALNILSHEMVLTVPIGCVAGPNIGVAEEVLHLMLWIEVRKVSGKSLLNRSAFVIPLVYLGRCA